ncbi:hypothetical protein WJX81_003097 [Elliptochloris bilobata]|uniref:Glycoside hydrolase family 5 domain-containing protein n=1 Tax=Elliptochloris bilobata TaxID=381761 RepID=A0AAW1RHI7_9CHLO
MERGATALVLLGLLSLSGRWCGALPLLTTQNGKIVDGDGNPVFIHGIAWFGFNGGATMTGNLSAGFDAVSQDFKTVVWRIKQLGFNAVRLPVSFSHFADDPKNFTMECTVPPPASVAATMVPPKKPVLPLSNAALPSVADVPFIPPEAWTGGLATSMLPGTCNADLPNDSTRNRYIWVVKYLINEGFYVNIDFHSIGMAGEGLGLKADDNTLYNTTLWVGLWYDLLSDVFEVAPEAKGRLLIDFINEPDGYGLTWEGSKGIDSLTDIYITVMDALWPICPDCLFLIEGGGQVKLLANWGNGFATDPAVLSKLKPKVSDASSFFIGTWDKPYVNQIVLAPHFYCPAVSGANFGYKPSLGQYQIYNETFGYLTSKGFCYKGKCRVYAGILDEFGSTFEDQKELDCWRGIVDYMNNAPGPARDGWHGNITSWFYWSWNPDSIGTGGMVDPINWRTIEWLKMDAMTGGTPRFRAGLRLKPWYLAGFQPLNRTGNSAPSPAPVIQLANAGLTPLEKYLMIAASPFAGCAVASMLLFALWAVGWCERAPPPEPDDGESPSEKSTAEARHGLRGGMPTSENSIFLQWGTDEWYAAEAAEKVASAAQA